MDAKSSFTVWWKLGWCSWRVIGLNSCFYDFWKVFSVSVRQDDRLVWRFTACLWSKVGSCDLWLSVQPQWEDWCWDVPLWAHKTDVTTEIPARPWEPLHGVTGNIPSIVNVPSVLCPFGWRKRNKSSFLNLYFKENTDSRYWSHLYTNEFWDSGMLPGGVTGGRGAGRWTEQVVWSSGASLHFLDNLACLFFGGAHFRHIVSTERERREKRPWDPRCLVARRQDSQEVTHGRTCLWWEVSCTGHSSGALQPVWASHRWHADPSSTWPCWGTAGCWWCHSEWCWSSGWGEEGEGSKSSRKQTRRQHLCVCVYLRSLMDSVPLKSLRISSRTQDQ